MTWSPQSAVEPTPRRASLVDADSEVQFRMPRPAAQVHSPDAADRHRERSRHRQCPPVVPDWVREQSEHRSRHSSDRQCRRRRRHRRDSSTSSDSTSSSSSPQRARREKRHWSRRQCDEGGDETSDLRRPQAVPAPENRPTAPEADGKENPSSIRERYGYSVGAKLGTYDGSTCLETFLARFYNCSRYFKWNGEDRLFQLCGSLSGPAGQILWDLEDNTTVEEVIRLLKNRFGVINQAERFRAELRSRKRKPDESLQRLYQDISRLMTLAYPGPTSELSNIVARDAFLDALNDNSLRIRILEKEPSNLDEALKMACRLEAYDESARAEVAHTGKFGNKEKFVRTAVGPSEQSGAALSNTDDDISMKQLRDSLHSCCSQMAQMRRDIEGLRQQSNCGPAYGAYGELGTGSSYGTQRAGVVAGPPSSGATAGPWSSDTVFESRVPGTSAWPPRPGEVAGARGPESDIMTGHQVAGTAGHQMTGYPRAEPGHPYSTPNASGYALGPRTDGSRNLNTAGGVRTKKGTTCHNCGREGHWAKSCPEPRRPSRYGVEAGRDPPRPEHLVISVSSKPP